MLSSLIQASVRFRWFVVLIVAAVAAWGLFELTKLPIDAVPDITNRQVQITTVAPALAPEQMEKQVTYPLETALAGIPGLTGTRSISRNGFSQITAVFIDSTDIYFARNQVGERLQRARERIPAGVEPAISPITTGLGEILMWTVDFEPFNASKLALDGRPGWKAGGVYLTPEGERLTTPEARATYLRTVQDWIIAPQLRTVEGVAGVDTIGGYEKEYAVRPDPARLSATGVSLSEVVEALEQANVQAGAGFVEQAGEAIVVRADAVASSVEDLIQAPITSEGGRVVRIGDVATVEIGQAPRFGAASRNGHEAVVGTALMLSGENSRTVARRVSAKLEGLAPSMPPSIAATAVLDRSKLVNSTIATVSRNLAEGALLVIAVLFLLLGNIRAATITALMIPLSFLFAVIGMNKFGISGNLMSLGALDFGLLVDGAVIVIESTLLLLAQKRAELGRMLAVSERLSIAVQSARKMVKPAAFGQLIILLVYAPLLTLEGVEGKMFQPMAATVMLALVGAFIFSFTFVPAMTALLVREPKTVPHGTAEHETRIIAFARRHLTPVIAWAVKRPAQIAIAAVAMVVIGLGGFMALGREFIPTLDEGDVALFAARVPSASLNESLQMQMALERAVSAMPEVELVFAKTGTAEVALDPMPQNVSDSIIILKDRREWPDRNLSKDELIEKIEERVSSEIGNNFEFSQPIELRFNELISGVRSDVAIQVFGEDFAVLERTASQIAAALQTVDGASDVRVEQVSGLPSLTVSVDRSAAASYGLSAQDVSDSLAIGVGGREAGRIFEGDRSFNVAVRLSDTARNDPATLAQLPVISDAGLSVPLSSVARITLSEGPNQISRDNGSRRIMVQANVRGRDLGGFVAEAQAEVREAVQLPPAVYLDWGGQFENLQRAQARLLIVVPVVFLLIGLVLFMALGSFSEAALVFACVPLALVGGVLALLLRGMPFSISAAVGFIAVSGVATLNGLVLMQAIRQRLEEGVSSLEAAVEGASSRLRAVLTTALVAIVGFIPMAIAHGSGAEVQKPLATVVIGGLLTATVLTLLVLPTFAAKAIRHRKAEGLED